MHVLLIVCAADDSAAAQISHRLSALVRGLLRAVRATDARIDLHVRTHAELGDFTPHKDVPLACEEREQLDRLKRFDMLDLVFVYGAPDFGWAEEGAQGVRWLLRNCLLARKYVSAWGSGMQLVAYTLGTGGEVSATPVRALDGAPVSALPPPGGGLLAAGQPLLDASTGELLRWDAPRGCWAALGADGGSHLASAHPAAPFVLHERAQAVRDLRFDADTACRHLHAHVPAHAAHHPLVGGFGGLRATLGVRNRWRCHLRTRGAYGRFGPLRALLVHAQGLQAFEVGNCLAAQCELSASCAHALELGRRFAERAVGELARAREGMLGTAHAARLPVQLAFIAAQPAISAVPSEQLDALALLAPHADARRRTREGGARTGPPGSGLGEQRGCGEARPARATPAWGGGALWLDARPPPPRGGATAPAFAASGVRCGTAPAAVAARPPPGSRAPPQRPSSARVRTVLDAVPASAPLLSVPGVPAVAYRARPASARAPSAAEAAAERAGLAAAGVVSVSPRAQPAGALRATRSTRPATAGAARAGERHPGSPATPATPGREARGPPPGAAAAHSAAASPSASTAVLSTQTARRNVYVDVTLPDGTVGRSLVNRDGESAWARHPEGHLPWRTLLGATLTVRGLGSA